MRESEKLDEANRAATSLKQIVRKQVGPGAKGRRLIAKIHEMWERRFWARDRGGWWGK